LACGPTPRISPDGASALHTLQHLPTDLPMVNYRTATIV
jgi:hypothetical protein